MHDVGIMCRAKKSTKFNEMLLWQTEVDSDENCVCILDRVHVNIVPGSFFSLWQQFFFLSLLPLSLFSVHTFIWLNKNIVRNVNICAYGWMDGCALLLYKVCVFVCFAPNAMLYDEIQIFYLLSH